MLSLAMVVPTFQRVRSLARPACEVDSMSSLMSFFNTKIGVVKGQMIENNLESPSTRQQKIDSDIILFVGERREKKGEEAVRLVHSYTYTIYGRRPQGCWSGASYIRSARERTLSPRHVCVSIRIAVQTTVIVSFRHHNNKVKRMSMMKREIFQEMNSNNSKTQRKVYREYMRTK